MLLAVFGTVLLVSYVNGAADRAAAGEKVVKVLVVRNEVPVGTSAADLEGDVRTEEVPAKVRAEGAVTALDDLDAKLVTTVALRPGEQLLRSRFGRVGALGVRRLSAPDNLLEVTVSLEPERALGGTVTAGDKVAVFSSFEGMTPAPGDVSPREQGFTDVDGALVSNFGPNTPNSTHLTLHKVLVTNVQVDAEDATNTDNTDSSTDSTEAAKAPKRNLLVTLAVNAHDAERLVFTAEHGFVWLANEPADAPETGTQVQTRITVNR